MVKVITLLKKLKVNLEDNHIEKDMVKKYKFLKYDYEKMKLFVGNKNLCITCNRFMTCKNSISHMVQFDFHSYDHLTFNDYPKHVPLNSFQFSIDKESLIFNIHLKRIFLTHESLSIYLSNNLAFPMESFYYINNIRKDREYLFLRYRISKYYRKKFIKKLNGKNFLHNWNEIKYLGNSWNSQRGEIGMNLIERPKKKRYLIKNNTFVLYIERM